MAYLNVRERKIETKIAYVGPGLAGKTTSLHRIKSDEARGRAGDVALEGDTLSLEWRPLQMDRFNDCDLAVKLVASKGAISTDRLDGLLEDADGVVVVVDATPSAQEENRRAVMLVREALSRTSAPSVPVVVQLNKSDLADALPASEVARAIAVSEDDAEREWPVVTASAVRGEGVVEALEIALASVIEAMKAKAQAGSTAAIAPKIEHNPLLGALRDILRETVSEHMAAVRHEIAEAVTAKLGQAHDAIEELRAEMRMLAKERERAVEAQAAAITELARLVAEVHAASLQGCTLEDLAASEARLRDGMASQSRVDREHITSVASVLRRSVETIAVDVKKQDTLERQTRLLTELGALQAKVDALSAAVEPAAVAVRGVPAQIGALEKVVERGLHGTLVPRLAKLEDSVQVMHVDSSESFQRTDARTSEIQGGLNELLEELRRRKKGWFS
ncbi:MAG: hypothetical protein KF795_20145 [Labilithrix sp.]|nr:hypothetical protein [Labilithrix sp.]